MRGADDRGDAITHGFVVTLVEQCGRRERRCVRKPADRAVGERGREDAAVAHLAHEPDTFRVLSDDHLIQLRPVAEEHLSRLMQFVPAVDVHVDGATRGTNRQIMPSAVIPCAARMVGGRLIQAIRGRHRDAVVVDRDGEAFLAALAGGEKRAVLAGSAHTKMHEDRAGTQRAHATHISRGELGRGEVDVRCGSRRQGGDAFGGEGGCMQTHVGHVDGRAREANRALAWPIGSGERRGAQVRRAAEALRAVKVDARAELAECERERVHGAVGYPRRVLDVEIDVLSWRRRAHAQRVIFDGAYKERRVIRRPVEGIEDAPVRVCAEPARDRAFG